MSLADDFDGAFTKYVTSPAKQLNLGWTVTSYYYSLPVIIGLMLVVFSMLTILYNGDYLSGTKSKMPLVFIAWVGLAMVVIGLYLTIRNFTAVVKRINANIRVHKEDSLFQEDTGVTALISTINRANNNISIRDAQEDPVGFAQNPAASLSHVPKITRESLARNEPTPFRSRPKTNAQAAARETSQDIKASASNIDRADKSTSQSLGAMQAVVNTLPQDTEEQKKAVQALQANIAKVQDNTAQVAAETKHIKDAAPVIEQVAAAAAKKPDANPGANPFNFGAQFRGPGGQPGAPSLGNFLNAQPTFFAQGIPQIGVQPGPPQSAGPGGDEIDIGGGFTFKY
jgi:hypothetical protein